ncbi:MAG TPA: DUF4157 domain-containing protein [Allosphingosinicella sp.]|nr:DUF4157 domain-containing protein [Allosphingosinicella sp.]
MTGAALLQRAAPADAVVAAAPKLLQRACACGGSAGVSGKCAGCDSEEKLGVPPLQAKLTVSAPDDPYEKEADEVAERVMRMPAAGAGPIPVHPVIQREAEEPLQRDPVGPEEEEEEPLAQRKAATGAGPAVPAGFAATLGARPGGAALPTAARSFFEPRFQRDLGHVRIHDGASAGAMARDINARAFTAGRDIYFAPGQYDPASGAGRRLLAHELTHVFQQGGERTLRRKALDAASAHEPTVRIPMDSPHNPNEAAAETVAAEAGGSGDSPPPAAGGAAPSDGAAELPASLAAGILRPGGGSALPGHARAPHERRLGSALDHVRIHQGPGAARLADALGARAFTYGHDIWLGDGESVADRRLVAHELTHVAQQPGGADGVVRRAPAEPDTRATEPPPDAELREARAAPRGVTGITMACRPDMRMRIETETRQIYYTMDSCDMPLGDYKPTVTVTGDDFRLDFGDAAEEGERFHFSYRVEPDQQHPGRLLEGQRDVDVHVVPRLPKPDKSVPPKKGPEPEAECVMRLASRQLVPPDSLKRNLFEPINVADFTIWEHDIPLGPFGWINVAAKVGADVSGTLDARYGPGTLSDICLTRLRDRATAAYPEGHPLFRDVAESDTSIVGVGGRARFSLPARASVTLKAEGRLEIDGSALGLIEVASAKGSLTATGTATLAGNLDAGVDVMAKMKREENVVEEPDAPVAITEDGLQGLDLSAQIGLRGNAALKFRLDGGASFSLLGKTLWDQHWNLANFNAAVGWKGGLSYSPNPGLYWDLGEFGEAMAESGIGEFGDDEALDDVAGHEDQAEIDAEDIVDDLFEERNAVVTTPQGLSEDDALPFDWRKPMEFYPETLPIPRAETPAEVNRDDGPTYVRYLVRGKPVTTYLGVADWPDFGSTFQFTPYDVRITPTQRTFNTLLDRLGFNRSGFDAEHVWDVGLRGIKWDRFDNLWPASSQEQQLAGVQHDQQIDNYRATIGGNINGRWFRIDRIRHSGQL